MNTSLKQRTLCKCDTIINKFFKALDEIIAKTENNIIEVENYETTDYYIIQMGYFYKEPLFTITIDKKNEDLYNYIISEIFIKLKYYNNKDFSKEFGRFIMWIERPKCSVRISLKGTSIFFLDCCYDNRYSYIEILKKDMKSEYFRDEFLIDEEMKNNEERIRKIGSKSRSRKKFE